MAGSALDIHRIAANHEKGLLCNVLVIWGYSGVREDAKGSRKCTNLPPLSLPVTILEESLIVGHTIFSVGIAGRLESASYAASAHDFMLDAGVEAGTT